VYGYPEGVGKGGFSPAEYEKLGKFDWKTWAASHNVPAVNYYAKWKISPSSANTIYITLMVEEGNPDPWNYTYEFSTEAELRAADLTEECEWISTYEAGEAGSPAPPVKTKGNIEVLTLTRR
jgi:hypothetical protein